MISFLGSLLIVALFGWLVYHFAPAPGERWDRMITRYRPHAPMSDWSVADYEGQRQYSDLAAIRSRQEVEDLRDLQKADPVRHMCGSPAVQS